jgi:hypothetical protein
VKQREKMLFSLGMFMGASFLFALPAFADDCSGLSDCFGTLLGAMTGAAAAVGASVAGALGISSSSPGEGAGTYGPPMTPQQIQETERLDPPIEYDPWGGAILGVLGGAVAAVGGTVITGATGVGESVLPQLPPSGPLEGLVPDAAGHIVGDQLAEHVYPEGETEEGKEQK